MFVCPEDHIGGRSGHKDSCSDYTRCSDPQGRTVVNPPRAMPVSGSPCQAVSALVDIEESVMSYAPSATMTSGSMPRFSIDDFDAFSPATAQANCTHGKQENVPHGMRKIVEMREVYGRASKSVKKMYAFVTDIDDHRLARILTPLIRCEMPKMVAQSVQQWIEDGDNITQIQTKIGQMGVFYGPGGFACLIQGRLDKSDMLARSRRWSWLHYMLQHLPEPQGYLSPMDDMEMSRQFATRTSAPAGEMQCLALHVRNEMRKLERPTKHLRRSERNKNEARSARQQISTSKRHYALQLEDCFSDSPRPTLAEATQCLSQLLHQLNLSDNPRESQLSSSHGEITEGDDYSTTSVVCVTMAAVFLALSAGMPLHSAVGTVCLVMCTTLKPVAEQLEKLLCSPHLAVAMRWPSKVPLKFAVCGLVLSFCILCMVAQLLSMKPIWITITMYLLYSVYDIKLRYAVPVDVCCTAILMYTRGYGKESVCNAVVTSAVAHALRRCSNGRRTAVIEQIVVLVVVRELAKGIIQMLLLMAGIEPNPGWDQRFPEKWRYWCDPEIARIMFYIVRHTPIDNDTITCFASGFIIVLFHALWEEAVKHLPIVGMLFTLVLVGLEIVGNFIKNQFTGVREYCPTLVMHLVCALIPFRMSVMVHFFYNMFAYFSGALFDDVDPHSVESLHAHADLANQTPVIMNLSRAFRSINNPFVILTGKVFLFKFVVLNFVLQGVTVVFCGFVDVCEITVKNFIRIFFNYNPDPAAIPPSRGGSCMGMSFNWRRNMATSFKKAFSACVPKKDRFALIINADRSDVIQYMMCFLLLTIGVSTLIPGMVVAGSQKKKGKKSGQNPNNALKSLMEAINEEKLRRQADEDAAKQKMEEEKKAESEQREALINTNTNVLKSEHRLGTQKTVQVIGDYGDKPLPTDEDNGFSCEMTQILVDGVFVTEMLDSELYLTALREDETEINALRHNRAIRHKIKTFTSPPADAAGAFLWLLIWFVIILLSDYGKAETLDPIQFRDSVEDKYDRWKRRNDPDDHLEDDSRSIVDDGPEPWSYQYASREVTKMCAFFDRLKCPRSKFSSVEIRKLSAWSTAVAGGLAKDMRDKTHSKEDLHYHFHPYFGELEVTKNIGGHHSRHMLTGNGDLNRCKIAVGRVAPTGNLQRDLEMIPIQMRAIKSTNIPFDSKIPYDMDILLVGFWVCEQYERNPNLLNGVPRQVLPPMSGDIARETYSPLTSTAPIAASKSN